MKWLIPPALLLITCTQCVGLGWADAAPAVEGTRDHLKRAKVFLAAGDYRHALEACQKEVEEAPSAASYVYLTYVFQAIDGYLDYLATTDRWVGVEQLYWNLISQGPRDLTDPPDVLARIAKEIIQESSRKQSDVTAAMAERLDASEVRVSGSNRRPGATNTRSAGGRACRRSGGGEAERVDGLSFVLTQRARLECARWTRAVKDSPSTL